MKSFDFKVLIIAALILNFQIGFAADEQNSGSRGDRSESSELFEKKMRSLVDQDLRKLNSVDNRRLSRDGINKLNQETLDQIQRFTPSAPSTSSSGMRKAGFAQVDVSVADSVLKSMKIHPVVNEFKYDYYNEKATGDIGYCFGRAFYADRMLRRLGVNKESIRKIYIVGNLDHWDYHVATMVYTNKGWMVMDPLANDGKLTTPEQWFNQHQTLNNGKAGNRAQVFVTDADKFGITEGEYDTIQMGYKKIENGKEVPSKAEDDFFKHYFFEISKHDTKKENWPRLGLTKLIPAEGNMSIGTLNSNEINPAELYKQLKPDLEKPFRSQRSIERQAARGAATR